MAKLNIKQIEISVEKEIAKQAFLEGYKHSKKSMSQKLYDFEFWWSDLQFAGAVKSSDENSALPLHDVGGSSEADYWSERCKLMENIEEENPCDPDITEKQINAWSKYHNFIKEKGQRNYR